VRQVRVLLRRSRLTLIGTNSLCASFAQQFSTFFEFSSQLLGIMKSRSQIAIGHTQEKETTNVKHWMNQARHGTMHGPFRAWGRPGMNDDAGFEGRMAEALGVSVEQLQAAREQAFDNGLQEAVDEGELAPKQAERMRAWRRLRPYLNPPTLAAQVLNMTPEQFQAALDEGKSLWDLAKEQEIDFATGREKFLAAGRAAVQQAVADGVISQEQADEFVQMARQRGGPGSAFRGRGGFGPMGWFGRRRGFGPMAFFGRGRCGGPWNAGWGSAERAGTTPPDVI
jgi:hypothetical protein